MRAGETSPASARRELRAVVCTSSEVTAFVVQGILERIADAAVDLVSLPRRSRDAADLAGLARRLERARCELLVLDVEPFGSSVLRWLEDLHGASERPSFKLVLLAPADFSLGCDRARWSGLVLRKPLDLAQATAELEQLLPRQAFDQPRVPFRQRLARGVEVDVRSADRLLARWASFVRAPTP